MVRPIAETSYEHYLDYVNRDRRRKLKTECECGKILYEQRMEEHARSAVHKKLMKLKEASEEIKRKREEANKKHEEELQEKTLSPTMLLDNMTIEQQKELLIKLMTLLPGQQKG